MDKIPQQVQHWFPPAVASKELETNPMTDSSEKQPDRETEPQTLAEAAIRIREGGLFEELKEVEPETQSEEKASVLAPHIQGEEGS